MCEWLEAVAAKGDEPKASDEVRIAMKAIIKRRFNGLLRQGARCRMFLPYVPGPCRCPRARSGATRAP